MTTVNVKIEGMDQLVANFKKAPVLVTRYMNLAIRASIAEIHKNADDSGDSKLFQFKTQRSMRTGYLALSFTEGIKFSDLYGEIGPRANYAPYVYFGTGRGIQPNAYMDRIAKASEDQIGKHFNDAIGEITNELSTI